MVLSLKAGGTGLNLSAANHVIHFDHWWNPAVENQATDRAYRLGQKKDVFVYTLLTRGTLEEHIDEMIFEKTQISEAVIQENKRPRLTELTDREILALFAL